MKKKSKPSKHALKLRKWHTKNPGKKKEYMDKFWYKLGITKEEYMRSVRLKYYYGLTKKKYVLLIEKQSFVCAICFRPNTKGRRLNIDHNHATGKVRGLLCSSCNLGLHYVEDIIYLRAAKKYLMAQDRKETPKLKKKKKAKKRK